MKTWVSKTKTCTYPDCTRPLTAGGLCSAHYQRKRAGRPMSDPIVEVIPHDEQPDCAHPGCDRRRGRDGRFCQMHYRRNRLGQDMNAPSRLLHGEPSEWKINTHGYVARRVVIDGERVTQLQHREVMKSILGRDLLPHENVHHINGDRADNDPANLELWSTSQPAGQRVEDKIAWAIKFLNDYGVKN